MAKREVTQSRLSIEDFKSNLANGGVRPTMFEASMTFPRDVASIFDDTDSTGTGGGNEGQVDSSITNQKFTFLCKACTLPGSQIGVINVPFRGRRLKVSGDRQFADWTVTIINDTDMRLRRTMEKWAEIIQNHNYALGANTLDSTQANGETDSGYFGTADVRQLDRQGNQLRLYEFNGIWPSNIADIQLGFDQFDTIEEYDVTFCVQYWHAGGPTAEGGDLGGLNDKGNTRGFKTLGNTGRIIS